MNYREELDLILSQPIESVVELEQSAFDRIAGKFYSRIVLFGAGGLGRIVLGKLRRIGIEPLAFVDNNPLLWGSSVDGIKVFPPQEGVEKYADSAVFVITIWHHGSKDRMSSRRKQLADLGCKRVTDFTTLFCKYPQEFMPYYMVDLPSCLFQYKDQILSGFSVLSDDFSRAVFVSEVKFRATLQFSEFLPPVKHPTFFPDDLWKFGQDGIFLDCGAFIGDTIKPFIELYPSFKEIIAFEPDQLSFTELSKYISELPAEIRHKIQMHKLGVANFNGEIAFASTGLASSKSGFGSEKISCVKLDDFITESPNLIKMDIEGAEYDALLGAQIRIKQDHPNLSICVYHRPTDLWTIPLLIHSFDPAYRIYLRPHQLEGWDLVSYATI